MISKTCDAKCAPVHGKKAEKVPRFTVKHGKKVPRFTVKRCPGSRFRTP